MEIKAVTIDDILPIRIEVLRKGRPIEEGYFDGEREETTFHLGAYNLGKLVSVASFYKHNLDEYTGEGYRLRGMATLPGYRGKGYGSGILFKAMDVLVSRNADYLWCNARTTAIEFYEKLGMKVISEEFDIPKIGPHKVMIITLKKNEIERGSF